MKKNLVLLTILSGPGLGQILTGITKKAGSERKALPFLNHRSDSPRVSRTIKNRAVNTICIFYEAEKQELLDSVYCICTSFSSERKLSHAWGTTRPMGDEASNTGCRGKVKIVQFPLAKSDLVLQRVKLKSKFSLLYQDATLQFIMLFICRYNTLCGSTLKCVRLLRAVAPSKGRTEGHTLVFFLYLMKWTVFP